MKGYKVVKHIKLIKHVSVTFCTYNFWSTLLQCACVCARAFMCVCAYAYVCGRTLHLQARFSRHFAVFPRTAALNRAAACALSASEGVEHVSWRSSWDTMTATMCWYDTGHCRPQATASCSRARTRSHFSLSRKVMTYYNCLRRGLKACTSMIPNWGNST